jgi:hypothetical protein
LTQILGSVLAHYRDSLLLPTVLEGGTAANIANLAMNAPSGKILIRLPYDI